MDKKKTTEKGVQILCLHGHRQNGRIFRSKLGALRKILKHHANLVFIDAPHRVQPTQSEGTEGTTADQDDSDSSSDNDKRELSWWFNKEDRTFKGTNVNGPAYGFDESLAKVEEAWNSLGPFQGILGFSQGACFAGIICLLARKHMTSIKPEFAIICSGFVSQSLAHHRMYDGSCSLPSLHISGNSDTIITTEMSKALLSVFDGGQLIEHDGGHFFPATGDLKKKYLKFIKDRIEDHLTFVEMEQKRNNLHPVISESKKPI